VRNSLLRAYVAVDSQLLLILSTHGSFLIGLYCGNKRVFWYTHGQLFSPWANQDLVERRGNRIVGRESLRSSPLGLQGASVIFPTTSGRIFPCTANELPMDTRE
jgi:hypothetical protein